LPAQTTKLAVAIFLSITLGGIAFVPGSVHATTNSTTASSTTTVNLLLNYGNGTLVWYNNTSVPTNANFFNVTTIVTNGNVGAVFFASFGSHFVYSINNVGCIFPNIFCEQAWAFWTLDGICWDLPEVGVDQIPVSRVRTVAWFLNPVASFGDFPPTGTTCLPITIQVKPGDTQTTINPQTQGNIPVAVLTTTGFDATTVNPMTARFGVTGTEASPVHWAFEDVNGDGKLDLILQFLTTSTGIQSGDTQVTLMGRTLDGTPLRGFATIQTTRSH